MIISIKLIAGGKYTLAIPIQLTPTKIKTTFL